MRFTTDLSVWWLLPWLLISILGGLWLYRNVSWWKELSSLIRWTLVSLRSAVLFILGLLLIGLIFEAVDYRVEKPLIIALTDNSSSLLNYKDSASVKKDVNALRTTLKTELGEDYEWMEMTVGNTPKFGGTVDFSESVSQLSSAFEKINTEYFNRNIGAIVFISDGKFNAGSNPVYSAERIDLTPVFTVGVGDTVKKRDQFVKNVATNDITFLGNKFPVEVDLEGIKMGKGTATVSILRDGKQLTSQQVNYVDGVRDFQHASFLLDADRIGFQTYSVVISKAGNEYNYANNSRTFYVEVIDSRSKVLILAGAPHPDIAAWREVLELDENLEVESILLKDWKKDLTKTDLVIWHEPGIGFDASVQQLLEDKKIPVLYTVGPNTSASVIQKLTIGISATSANGQTDDVQGGINTGFQQFEISDALKNMIESGPPLKSKFGEIKTSGGIEVLANQRLGSIRKTDPLIFFTKSGQIKVGVIYGEGIWRWKMNEYVRTGAQEGFTEFVNKIAQYLLVKQNTSRLRVNFPKRFTKDEDVIVNANYYNQSLEPVSDAEIRLEVRNEKGKLSKVSFGVAGKQYVASLGKLPPGIYTWKAVATRNGQAEVKSGVFVVEDMELEDLDTYADHQLLRQIAKSTGGKFFELKNANDVLKAIQGRDDITTVSYRDATFKDLADLKWLFFLLLMCLALEWFLRRWFGAY
jgi:hypothetical protein